jgi:hypothetical protein
MTQALGVIHILVSSKATKYRLSEEPGQCMPTILASACVGQHITRQHGQADCVVEFAIGQQRSPRNRETGASGGGQNRAEQHPILIHPSGSPSLPRAIQNKLLTAISESRKSRRNSVHYPVNADWHLSSGSLRAQSSFAAGTHGDGGRSLIDRNFCRSTTVDMPVKQRLRPV